MTLLRVIFLHIEHLVRRGRVRMWGITHKKTKVLAKTATAFAIAYADEPIFNCLHMSRQIRQPRTSPAHNAIFANFIGNPFQNRGGTGVIFSSYIYLLYYILYIIVKGLRVFAKFGIMNKRNHNLI